MLTLTRLSSICYDNAAYVCSHAVDAQVSFVILIIVHQFRHYSEINVLVYVKRSNNGSVSCCKFDAFYTFYIEIPDFSQDCHHSKLDLDWIYCADDIYLCNFWYWLCIHPVCLLAVWLQKLWVNFLMKFRVDYGPERSWLICHLHFNTICFSCNF